MKQLTLAIVLGLATSAGVAQARDQIEIAGSSTVFPFSTTVAEQFAKKTGTTAPKVESTGTGGGFKLFCAGIGVETTDFSNASRRMKKKEWEKCQANGVKDITEVQVGFDGIAIANAKGAPALDLSRRDLYLALAKEVPAGKDGAMMANPYRTWADVNPKLPATKIEVIGPPPTSGTRDAFVELAMHKGCAKVGDMKALKKQDKKQFKQVCGAIREDGAYVEAGENDNLIVSKLNANPDAVGIFGFSFLDQNADKVKGASIEGNPISFDNIASGKYPISRPLFFYAKNAHAEQIKGMKEFIAEFTSEEAWGPNGYLVDKGLIPLSDAKRAEIAASAQALKPMSGSGLK